MRLLNSALYAILFLIFTSQIHSQTFGFGCLGFVGGYGGYTYQQIDAKGLNTFVQSFNETRNSSIADFKYATGYRVGINFFRAKFNNGMIVTAKGYYQSLGKKNKATDETLNGMNDYSFDLDLKNWGVGLDLGVDLFKGLSWKVIDGAVHFNNVKLTTTENTPGNSEINEYKSDGNVLSYSVGTGLIFSIVQDYISIEGLAGYTSLKIEEMKNNLGTPLTVANRESQNIIDSGGFTAVIQLNVGFPLL
jgi:hypothetical protein